MAVFAEKTKVSMDQTAMEIQQLLRKRGATAILYGQEDRGVCFQFTMNERQLRFVLPMPARGRMTEQQHSQLCRSRYRALLASIKAKFIAVESGITVFEQEFLPHVVLPNGQTVDDLIRPKLALAYEKHEMPKLLPMLEA